MKRTNLTLLAALLLGACALPPQLTTGFKSFEACSGNDQLQAMLKNNWNEFEQHVGLTRDGHLVTVYHSYGGRTWTLVTTTKTGVSCAVATGSNWTTLPGESY